MGCANVAKKYGIRAFQSLEAVEKIFIASRDKAKSKAIAETFNIQSKDSYEDLVNAPDIDAIYIPLPVGLHEEWVLKAAFAKKHILCEKSLSHSLASVKRILKACQQNGVVLFENFMCNYHPQHEKVLTLIHKGKLGDLFVFQGYFGFPQIRKDDIRYNKKLGGGSLNDVGAYPVFMARKIFGDEPTSVTCRLIHDPDSGVDIKGTATLEFPGNKIAFVAFGFGNVYQNDYSLWGSRGFVRVDRAYSIPPDMKPVVELYTNENLHGSRERVEVPSANHFELIFNDFCEVIRNDDNEKRLTKYEQILNQAVALEAMRMSDQEKQKVQTGSVH